MLARRVAACALRRLASAPPWDGWRLYEPMLTNAVLSTAEAW